MKKSTFEEENVLLNILKFSIPSTLSSIISIICTLTDRFFIGNLVGRDGISAMSVVFPYTMIVNSVIFLFSGLSILIGIKLGEKRKYEAEEILSKGFLYLIIIGIVLSTILWLFNETFLWKLGATRENIILAKEYTKYFILMICFQFILSQSTIIRAIGYPFNAMVINIFVTILNGILDYIFLAKLFLGVAGASLATFISVFLGSIYVLVFFFRNDVVKLKINKMKFEILTLVSIFKIGIPRFINQFFQFSLSVVMLKQMGKYSGDLGIASIGIISLLRDLINTSFQGFSQGTPAIIAYYYGAKNFKKIQEVMKIHVRIVLSISLFCLIITLINAEYIISFFVKNDVELIKYASHGTRVHLCLLFSTALFLSYNNFFQAIKDSKKATFFYMLRVPILNIPLIFILSYFFQDNGVLVAFPVSDFITSLIAMYIGKKEIEKLISNSRD